MAPTAAIPSPGYRPRPPSNDLKEIVEDALEDLLRTWDDRFQEKYGPLSKRVQELFERFLCCGDLHYGFLRWRCANPDCSKKEERLVPFSCRTRGLCPSCGQRRAIEWAARMVEEVLPLVPYRQLVFTIPIALRKAFLFDRSLYGDLCRVAYAATRDFLRSKAPVLARQGKAVPAMIVSPQSFGDLLVAHSHAHAVVSLGLFRKDGLFFPMEEVDFSGLEAVFRERFFKMLLRKEKILPETVERFKAWEHSGFSVNWERRITPEDRQGLERLLTYMERPAVSLRRLNYREDGRVHYQGSKFHPRLGIDHQLLSPVEFLALLVPHILLKYEITLRLYGALSTTWRRKLGWIEIPPVHSPPPEAIPLSAMLPLTDPTPLPPSPPPPPPPPADSKPPDSGPDSGPDEDPDSVQKRKRSWAKLIQRTWNDDPQICSSCGKPMKLVAAIALEQKDVIERILRSLKLWDPPWKRQRKARGPPPSTGAGKTTETSTLGDMVDPLIDDELHFLDVHPQEDDDSRA
jgi:hypothetical protein